MSLVIGFLTDPPTVAQSTHLILSDDDDDDDDEIRQKHQRAWVTPSFEIPSNFIIIIIDGGNMMLVTKSHHVHG